MSTIATPTTPTAVPAVRKIVKLSDLRAGETARVVHLDFADQGCRRRFAEMGLYEGAALRVTSGGETIMLAVGTSRMGVSAHCAESVIVLRLA